MKKCSKCKKTKPLSAFYVRRDRGNSVRSACKSCDKTENKEFYETYSRDRHLKKTYGITLEQYDAMLESQDGECAICGTCEPGGRGRFHVDHCHSSEEVRGLLCAACNLALGNFKDNIETLLSAVNYLRSHNG